MKKTRNKTFETNSSSTHSLSYCGNVNLDTYTPVGDKIVIEFINTDDGGTFTTLKRKVSYLVSHIVNNYKYNCLDYEDLVEQVSNSYDFKRISNYVKNKYGKEVVFPKEYKGDIDEIVYINRYGQTKCAFLPEDDDRIIGRGNPLLARNEFLTMDEVDKELSGEEI